MRIRYAVFALALVAATPASANILINVDKSAQRMTVTVDGVQRYTWPVSTGRAGYATPSGNFTTFRMEEDHYSKEWDDAPMPHSIFFTKEGHAIHGSYDVKHLGSAASHGCVRLSPANATILYGLVKEHGLPNTKVVLTGNAPAGGPAVAKRAPRKIQRDEAAYASRGYDQPRVGYGREYQPAYREPVYGRPAYDDYAPAYRPQPRGPFGFFN